MLFGGFGRLAIVLSLFAMLMPTAFGAGPVADQAGTGEYLARAGDRFGYDTKDGGAPLAGSRQIQTPYGTRAILGRLPANGTYAAMPGFAAPLTARQIAQIATYVRNSWGNAAPATETPGMVDKLFTRASTMLSGTGACNTVTPPAFATVIADDHVEPMLSRNEASNMYDQIGVILAKLSPAVRQMSRAEVTNGLTAASCAVESHDGNQAARQRLQQLQRFAGLVYARLGSSNGQN